MMNSDSKEFITVIITMCVLFILALIAVAIFIRQWRREHQETNKTPGREP